MNDKIGILVELDYCVGCYACQSACKDYNKLPIDKNYLKVLNTKPEEIDGALKMFMSPIPYNLDKCAECVTKEGVAPCTKICIGRCLHVDKVETLNKIAESATHRTLLFQ